MSCQGMIRRSRAPISSGLGKRYRGGQVWTVCVSTTCGTHTQASERAAASACRLSASCLGTHKHQRRNVMRISTPILSAARLRRLEFGLQRRSMEIAGGQSCRLEANAGDEEPLDHSRAPYRPLSSEYLGTLIRFSEGPNDFCLPMPRDVPVARESRQHVLVAKILRPGLVFLG